MHDDDDQHLEHHRLARLHRLVLIDLFEPHRSIRAITTQLVEQNRGAAPLKSNVEHWRAERDHRERMDAFPVAPWPGQLPAEEDTLAWGPINDLLQDMSIDVELDECRFEIIDCRRLLAARDSRILQTMQASSSSSLAQRPPRVAMYTTRVYGPVRDNHDAHTDL